MASPSCPTPTALASDALRPHRQQKQQQVPQQLLLCSGTQPLGTRPHTPRVRAAPALAGRTRLLAAPAGGGCSAPDPRPEMSPRHRRPRRAARASCARSLARGLAGWLAGAVAILSPTNSVPPTHYLLDMRSDARLKNGRPDWQAICQSHGPVLPRRTLVA